MVLSPAYFANTDVGLGTTDTVKGMKWFSWERLEISQCAGTGDEKEIAKALKISKKVDEIYLDLLFSKSHSTETRERLTSRDGF